MKNLEHTTRTWEQLRRNRMWSRGIFRIYDKPAHLPNYSVKYSSDGLAKIKWLNKCEGISYREVFHSFEENSAKPDKWVWYAQESRMMPLEVVPYIYVELNFSLS